jgi:oligopeptide transport system substrate-binding protein
MKKLLLLTMLLTLLLTACGRQEAGIFRCDIANAPANLDPQFATSPEAKMIIQNLFEGLVVLQPTGELIPGAADSWEISPDGLAYTFRLREGLLWQDETPLVAGDFAFALHRLLDPDMPSPHAENFIAMRDAKAVNDYTLVIELNRPDPQFLIKLASTAAMPCNREFFEASRGRYGLETRFMLANGPFTLGIWDNHRFIHLNRNERYHSPENVPQSARFYIGRGNPAQNLESGAGDFAEVPHTFEATAMRMGLVMEPMSSEIWGIAFNMRDPVWRTTLLRQALAQSIDHTHFEYVWAGSDVPYSVEEAVRLFEMGMSAAELPMTPPLAILVPDAGGHMAYMQTLQQDWQMKLSFFPRFQEFPAETLERFLRSGEFQAILMPFSSPSPQMGALHEQFRSTSPHNRIGYKNPVYDMFLDRAKEAAALEEMAAHYGNAERLLLSDAPVIPLYTQTTWYAATKEAAQYAWVYLGGRG